MYLLKETIGVERWQVFAMLALSGFAIGSMAAKFSNLPGLKAMPSSLFAALLKPSWLPEMDSATALSMIAVTFHVALAAVRLGEA